MFTLINIIYLNAIVASFMVLICVEARTPFRRITLNQYEGRWFEIGRISPSEEISSQSCIMYDIEKDKNNYFKQYRVPIDAIPGCEYGLPIYTYSKPGAFFHSAINVQGDEDHSNMIASINSYNNRTELILTEPAMTSGGFTSYRLWSRNRQVSAGTKAQFKTLAGNNDVIFYDWHLCPKLQSETDEEFTLDQFKGLWYEIANVYYGDVDNGRCTTTEIKVNDNQSFNFISHEINNGREVGYVLRGNIAGSKINLETSKNSDGSSNLITVNPVRCNDGADLILRMGKMPQIGMISRNPKVSMEMMAEFERVSKNFVGANDVRYPQENCPDRLE